MIKNILVIVAVLGLGLLVLPFVREFAVADTLNPLAQEYVRGAANDIHAPNVVTAVVVTYRGLDTLGEVTVLFLATAGVGFLLKRKKDGGGKKRAGTEILRTGASFLAPLAVMFGIYIFTHGHLTPGGGFQGGVVIASAMLLLSLAYADFRFSHGLIHWLESLSGAVYVGLGLLGLLLLGANSFLDPRYLPLGDWLRLFSAGAIPLIYSCIGIKVGAELSSVLDSMGNGEEQTC